MLGKLRFLSLCHAKNVAESWSLLDQWEILHEMWYEYVNNLFKL